MWVLREDRNEERKKGKLHTPVYYWNHASIIRFTSTSSRDNWLYMNNRNRTFFQLISWRNRKQLKSCVYIHELKKHAPDFLFDFPYLNFLFDFNLFLFGIFLEYKTGYWIFKLQKLKIKNTSSVWKLLTWKRRIFIFKSYFITWIATDGAKLFRDWSKSIELDTFNIHHLFCYHGQHTVDLIYSRKIFQRNFPFETKTTFQEFSSKVRLVVMDLDSFFNFFM